MPPAADPEALKTEELAAIVREVRERVRARYPVPGSGRAPVADLMPLVHARDAAEAQVAGIGTVNPRPPGPMNSLVQGVKRAIARGMDWFVRDQVLFNREMMACVNAALEALNEVNRALVDAQDLKDMRAHWAQWRAGWEQKLATNEMQFLRSVAELQGAFQHRATLMETNFREVAKSQHDEYRGALERATVDIQKRLWADLEKIRAEYERLIHIELRLIRQRLNAPSPAAPPVQAMAAPAPPPAPDLARFTERFRGPERHVKDQQRFYLSYFAGRRDVLDLGCGRGEFLELMREAGVPARGVDRDREAVERCRGKGLNAEAADLFAYLESLPEASLDGIFCAQVIEHLPPERIPELIRLAATRLVRSGLLAIETPNPECLAIFATHFYLDPTHTRPVPHPLVTFYMQEYGLGHTELHRRTPAVESIPALAELPESVRAALFGGLDYAILGRKLI